MANPDTRIADGNEKRDLSSFINEHNQYFTGRDWVFKEIDEWLKNEQTNVFLLTGNPGSGKTAVAARLVQLCHKSSAQKFSFSKYGLAFSHFCRAFDDPSLDPLRFVENLSRQLANRYEEFAKSLLNLNRSSLEIKINAKQTILNAGDGSTNTNISIESLSIGNLSARVAFDRLVRKPFDQMISLTPEFNDLIIILVDSLDEALSYDVEDNIASLIQDLTDDDNDLPTCFRLVLTSRPDPRISITRGKKLDLIADAPANIDEIKLYVDKRLDNSIFAHKGELADQKSELAHRISIAAKGNFLYARYVTEDIIPRASNLENIDSIKLPKGLYGVYRTFLKREIGRTLQRWHETYRIFFGGTCSRKRKRFYKATTFLHYRP